jgi:N-glycosylase/DNA lyase
MNRIPLDNYNLGTTLLGGQGFVWDYYPAEDTYIGKMQKSAVKLKYDGKHLYWQTYPEKDNWAYVEKYLRLDDDYSKVLATIAKDDHVKVAIHKYPGMRLIKQDLEEALLGFLASPQKSITLIRRSIRDFSEKYGRKVDVDGEKVSLFPETAVVASLSEDDIRQFGFGFRAKNILEAAKTLSKTDYVKKFEKLNEADAREELKKFRGIGDKVADCILVYSLGHDNAAPLDVWGLRIAHDLYGIDPKLKYEEKRKWIADYFEGYAAWAWQFLFEYVRGFEA